MTPISGCKVRNKASFRVSSAGFTLLEIMLVMTIIGIASILIVPNVGNLESRTFAAQVRQVNSLLNYARRSAVVRGMPSTVSFLADASEDDQPDNPLGNPLANNIGQWQSAGIGLRFRDSTERELEIEEKIEITFYPEGGSTGGTLLLTQQEQLVAIVINPFTGRISTKYEED